MIAIASKEIYRLDIKINVNGDKESSNKVKKVEETAEKAKKKLKDLGNQTASPTAKLNDKMSSPLEKLESKTKSLSDKTISPTAKLKDNATSGLDKVKSATEKLNNKEAKVKVKAEDQASSVIEKANNKLTSWLKAGTKKVISIALAGTLAMGGFGATTAIKTYSDFEKGLSNVKAVSQATDSEMKQLSNTAKSLGASTEWSAVQVTQAEELLGQAGFSTKENISALPGLLSLASAGDLDLAAATDIASGTLRSFNIDASNTSHVADVLALSASATNSDVTDLGETMKYVAPVSASLGISFEDTAAAAGLLSNQNIKGSQAGTVLRQAMARLASPTKEAAGLMKTYGINAFDTQGNMKPLSGVVDNLNSSLGKLTSQQRADIISTIFGTESMSGVLALMNQGGQSLSDLSKRLSDANGAAKDMANTKLDNLSGQWKILKSAVEGMNIALGERLAPYAKQFVTWFTSKIPEIKEGILSFVDYLSKNTDKLISLGKTAVTVTGSVMALSVASKTIGAVNGIMGFVNGVRSIATGAEVATTALSGAGIVAKILPALFSPIGIAAVAAFAVAGVAIKGYNDLMDESCLKTTEQLSLSERFMNSITGHKIKTEKEMEELGLVYNDFGYGVSDSFKTAAKDASKSLLDIEMNINRMSRNGSLNGDKFDSFKDYINNFVYDGINAIKSKQSQVKEELNKTFGLDGTISENEQNTLDYLEKYYQAGIDKELELRDDIYEIGSKAIADHGAILDSDMAQIKEKLAEIQALKLEYANAENEGERAYASSKFKSAAERVSGIEEASTLLQDRAKEHQDKLDEIQANYDKSIAYTKSLMKSATSDEDKQNLQSELDDLQKTRDESLKQAEEDWKSDLETLYEAYPKARGKLNEDTGEAFSVDELKSQDTMSKIQDSHSQLAGVATSGVYTLQNDVTKNLETLYVNVDEATGKIKGILNGTTGEIGAYSDEQKEKLMNLQDEYSKTGSEMQQLVTNQAMLNTSTDEVVNHFGDVVGQLENVQTAEDGTVTGILNINGTPIQITSNADGTITSLSEVNNQLDYINGRHVQAIIELRQTFSQEAIDYGQQDGARFLPQQNASGTDYATSGLSTVNERGWELSDRTVSVIGQYNNNPLVNLQSGTKIRSHMDSMNDMRSAVKEEVSKQVPHGTYQVAQAPVQVTGVGGLSFGDTNININGNQDVEAMIQQAMLQFGNTLRQAFSNIKR